MPRFLSTKESQRYTFFKNFSSGIREMGIQLGLSQDDINGLTNSTNALIEKYDAAVSAFTNYNITNSEKKSLEQTHTALVQFVVNKMKNGGNWSDAAAKTLDVYVAPTQTDLSNIKPNPVLKIVTSLIHIGFEKKGLTSVKIFSKINDDKDFTFLASPTVSPYIDERPLRTPGVAEIRYYKLVGLKNDKEVGHPSDVVWIAYAG